MTTNPFPFKVLFWFENDSKIITEIKRTDIQPASADKSLVYMWLVIQNEKQSRWLSGENENGSVKDVTVLTFRSMDQGEGMQIRRFVEGTLTWNAEYVHFNDERMWRVEPEHVPIELLELISNFLA